MIHRMHTVTPSDRSHRSSFLLGPRVSSFTLLSALFVAIGCGGPQDLDLGKDEAAVQDPAATNADATRAAQTPTAGAANTAPDTVALGACAAPDPNADDLTPSTCVSTPGAPGAGPDGVGTAGVGPNGPVTTICIGGSTGAAGAGAPPPGAGMGMATGTGTATRGGAAAGSASEPAGAMTYVGTAPGTAGVPCGAPPPQAGGSTAGVPGIPAAGGGTATGVAGTPAGGGTATSVAGVAGVPAASPSTAPAAGEEAANQDDATEPAIAAE